MDAEYKMKLFRIFDNAESASIEFDRVWNLLQVFDSNLEDDLCVIKPEKPETITAFLSQFKFLRAQLEAIEILFHGALDNMCAAIDTGYAFVRTNQF